MRADGILRPSTHGFWSPARRASDQSPGFSPPFSTRSRAMGLHSGAVDQDLLGRPSGLRKRVEQADPDAFCRPADIAVVEGFPRPVFWRSVDPATAGPQHIDDPADHPTIVHPRLASRVRRQMRLDLRVMDTAGRRLTALDRGLERGERQADVDRAADRIANRPTGPGVENDRNVSEAFDDGDI